MEAADDALAVGKVRRRRQKAGRARAEGHAGRDARVALMRRLGKARGEREEGCHGVASKGRKRRALASGKAGVQYTHGRVDG